MTGMNVALAMLLAQAGATPPAPAPATPPPTCAAPVYSQFDFWVGEWDVYPNIKEPAKAPLLAHSRIEKLYGGCAIRENWMPLKATGGGSLNAPDPATGRWYQYWLDSNGGRVEFAGGAVPGGMLLTGFWANVNGPGKDGLVRMAYSRIDDNTVRQFGEVSLDHGLTWFTTFDFIYRRAAKK
jgi:hypothetical protein